MQYNNFFDIILHIDKWLQYHQGPVIYVVIFALIFCETGLFFTPFLPGDSLIFAVGTLCAANSMSIWLSIVLLIIAGVMGDTSNYHIGKKLGPSVFRNEKVRFLNKNYLDRAHAFYEKHGSSTVVLGHFFPIIRTFVPFVAGMGSMKYFKFLRSNILGVALWVTILFNLGYWLVQAIPSIKDNFGIVEIVIIAVSCIPAAITFIKERQAAKLRKSQGEGTA